jgi:hypothetical protein
MVWTSTTFTSSPLDWRRLRAWRARTLGRVSGVARPSLRSALLSFSSLGALALEQLGASVHGAPPPGWPASGCLAANAAALGKEAVVGQASLCLVDGGLHAALDLQHLEPRANYVEWIASFDRSSLCSFGPLMYQVSTFRQACTLADLDGPAPAGTLLAVAATVADAQGVLHVDSPVRGITLPPHAQAWLLVTRPAWTPAPRPNRPVGDGTADPVARAVFEVP